MTNKSFEVSRNIKHGSPVTWRGKKLILASQKFKPIGVFNLGARVAGFTLEGERFNITIPQGFRTYGEAEVKAE